MVRKHRHIDTRRIDERIAELKERLADYKAREKQMLSASGAKQYSIGSRSLTRFDTSLQSVIDMIDRLERQIAELEARKCGCPVRGTVFAVPRDDR